MKIPEQAGTNVATTGKKNLMKRSANIVWQGTGKEGKGHVSTDSKLLEKAPYSWAARYTHYEGTNPEELLAAAHGSCFTMKLSFLLNEAGYTADKIETKATVTMEANVINESHLSVSARVPGISEEKFKELAEKSKNECPMSQTLKIKITMDATLVKENEYSPDESFVV